LSGIQHNSLGRRILLALFPIFGTWTWCNLGFGGAWQVERYKQALVLEANSLEPGGYIDPDESPKPKGFNDYQDQPLEVGARETGTSTAKKIGSVVVPPKSGP
jgi:hypothetical protein